MPPFVSSANMTRRAFLLFTASSAALEPAAILPALRHIPIIESILSCIRSVLQFLQDPPDLLLRNGRAERPLKRSLLLRFPDAFRIAADVRAAPGHLAAGVDPVGVLRRVDDSDQAVLLLLRPAADAGPDRTVTLLRRLSLLRARRQRLLLQGQILLLHSLPRRCLRPRTPRRTLPRRRSSPRSGSRAHPSRSSRP